MENNNRKRRFLEFALDLFSQNGIRGVTMDDLARQAAVSKKTIYLDFDSKNEVVSATMDMVVADLIAGFISNQRMAADPIQESLLNRPLFQRIIKLRTVFNKYHLQSYPSAMERLADFKARLQGIFKANIDSGIERGLYRADLLTENRSQILTELANWFLFERQADTSAQDFLQNFLLEAVVTAQGAGLVRQYFYKT